MLNSSLGCVKSLYAGAKGGGFGLGPKPLVSITIGWKNMSLSEVVKES